MTGEPEKPQAGLEGFIRAMRIACIVLLVAAAALVAQRVACAAWRAVGPGEVSR